MPVMTEYIEQARQWRLKAPSGKMFKIYTMVINILGGGDNEVGIYAEEVKNDITTREIKGRAENSLLGSFSVNGSVYGNPTPYDYSKSPVETKYLSSLAEDATNYTISVTMTYDLVPYSKVNQAIDVINKISVGDL